MLSSVGCHARYGNRPCPGAPVRTVHLMRVAASNMVTSGRDSGRRSGRPAARVPVVSGCVFCAIATGEVAAHVVLADDQTVAFLDARPLFKGHVLVIPRQHHETLADLPPQLIAPLFSRVRQLSAALPAALGSQGTFVALNNVVSQSVPHLHVHVVPRTRGDGLRGFFWPRQKYADEAEAAAVASGIRDALADPGS